MTLTLRNWQPAGDGWFEYTPTSWMTWVVQHSGEGWIWVELDHDNYDGENEFTASTSSSEQEFPTWEEAAADCELNCHGLMEVYERKSNA